MSWNSTVAGSWLNLKLDAGQDLPSACRGCSRRQLSPPAFSALSLTVGFLLTAHCRYRPHSLFELLMRSRSIRRTFGSHTMTPSGHDSSPRLGTVVHCRCQ